jgi:hypothetical protein
LYFFIVRKTTSEQEYVILTTIYLAGAKNTDSWHTRKGDLQRALLLHHLMAPSSVFVTVTGGERSPCEVFSLDKTIFFGSLEFVAN